MLGRSPGEGKGYPLQYSSLENSMDCTLHGVTKSRTRLSNFHFFINYVKASDYVDHNELWKILKEMGIPDYLTCLLRNLYAEQEATVRTRHGATDWFKLGKKYVKAIYCHLDYLTYMQSTSCEMLDWMTHKLGSRLPGDISTPQICS